MLSKDPLGKLIVAGSDKMIRVLDPKKNFQIARELQGHKDIVTCLSIVDNLVLSGGGNGWVLVHDYNSGDCLYGVGTTEKGACTCVEAIAPDYFVAGGADGKVVIFDYS